VWRTARGFAVYVARQCSEASRQLAKSLCDTAIAMGLRGNRSIPKEHYWQANFYVIKNTRCPTVLTENLFQDNHEDLEFLMSAEGKAKIVELHLKCIKAYCGV
jgi:N-acetylmuramoyl-L-alanine amidase